MNKKLLDLFALYAFLFALLVISPAYAQVDREKGTSSKKGPMMHRHGFEQYDSMFEGFGSKTFKEVSDTFGVPVEDAISDLSLPEDMDGLRFWRFKSSMEFQARELPVTWS